MLVGRCNLLMVFGYGVKLNCGFFVLIWYLIVWLVNLILFWEIDKGILVVIWICFLMMLIFVINFVIGCFIWIWVFIFMK